jgi:hypothetical protein
MQIRQINIYVRVVFKRYLRPVLIQIYVITLIGNFGTEHIAIKLFGRFQRFHTNGKMEFFRQLIIPTQ